MTDPTVPEPHGAPGEQVDRPWLSPRNRRWWLLAGLAWGVLALWLSALEAFHTLAWPTPLAVLRRMAQLMSGTLFTFGPLVPGALLLLAAPLLVPRLPQQAPAAHMGDGVDEAPVQQAQA